MHLKRVPVRGVGQHAVAKVRLERVAALLVVLGRELLHGRRQAPRERVLGLPRPPLPKHLLRRHVERYALVVVVGVEERRAQHARVQRCLLALVGRFAEAQEHDLAEVHELDHAAVVFVLVANILQPHAVGTLVAVLTRVPAPPGAGPDGAADARERPWDAPRPADGALVHLAALPGQLARHRLPDRGPEPAVQLHRVEGRRLRHVLRKVARPERLDVGVERRARHEPTPGDEVVAERGYVEGSRAEKLLLHQRVDLVEDEEDLDAIGLEPESAADVKPQVFRPRREFDLPDCGELRLKEGAQVCVELGHVAARRPECAHAVGHAVQNAASRVRAGLGPLVAVGLVHDEPVAALAEGAHQHAHESRLADAGGARQDHTGDVPLVRRFLDADAEARKCVAMRKRGSRLLIAPVLWRRPLDGSRAEEAAGVVDLRRVEPGDVGGGGLRGRGLGLLRRRGRRSSGGRGSALHRLDQAWRRGTVGHAAR